MNSRQPHHAAARFYRAFYSWTCRVETPGSVKCHSRSYTTPRTQPNLRFPLRCNATQPRHYRNSSSHAANTPNSNSSSPENTKKSTTTPPHPGKQPPELSHYMRWLMRRVVQPVVVITTSTSTPSTSPSQSSATEPPKPCAMTVSSFTTVTLTPTPYISFNIRKPSSTYTAITTTPTPNSNPASGSGTQGGDFLVHILSASAEGARIADVLARGNAANGLEILRESSSTVSDFTVPAEEGDSLKSHTSTLPLITGPGVLEVLHCRASPSQQIDVGDHVVLVAAVLRSITAFPNTSSDCKELGLAYMMRQYNLQDGDHIGPVERTAPESDDYVYREGADEGSNGRSTSPVAGRRNVVAPGPLVVGGGLRVSTAGRHTSGKPVTASYAPAKRRPPPPPPPAVKARSVGEAGQGQGEVGNVRKDEPNDGEGAARSSSFESEEIHRTMGLNVRRGDEGLPSSRD